MRRFVDRPEALAGEVGIDLGRRQVCVTEQFLHSPKVGSAFQQMRSVRVPEGVRVQGPPIGQRMALENPPGVSWTEASTPTIQENCTGWSGIGDEAGSGEMQPRVHGIGGGFTERDPAYFRSFPEHRDHSPPEVNVGFVEATTLRHPDSGTVEQLEHGQISQRDGSDVESAFVVLVFGLRSLLGSVGEQSRRGRSVEQGIGVAGSRDSRQSVHALR